MHEWWGLNDYAKKRAKMLAELGYVAFAADMFGDGRVTDQAGQAKEWMQEVTTTAIFITALKMRVTRCGSTRRMARQGLLRMPV